MDIVKLERVKGPTLGKKKKKKTMMMMMMIKNVFTISNKVTLK
jgi:hypothetical protein